MLNEDKKNEEGGLFYGEKDITSYQMFVIDRL